MMARRLDTKRTNEWECKDGIISLTLVSQMYEKASWFNPLGLTRERVPQRGSRQHIVLKHISSPIPSGARIQNQPQNKRDDKNSNAKVLNINGLHLLYGNPFLFYTSTCALALSAYAPCEIRHE